MGDSAASARQMKLHLHSLHAAEHADVSSFQQSPNSTPRHEENSGVFYSGLVVFVLWQCMDQPEGETKSSRACYVQLAEPGHFSAQVCRLVVRRSSAPLFIRPACMCVTM